VANVVTTAAFDPERTALAGENKGERMVRVKGGVRCLNDFLGRARRITL